MGRLEKMGMAIVLLGIVLFGNLISQLTFLPEFLFSTLHLPLWAGLGFLFLIFSWLIGE